MSVDSETVKGIARLANIRINNEQAVEMQDDLNTILKFVEQINQLDLEGVKPMVSAVDIGMKTRPDKVDGVETADDIVANAPVSDHNFFMVPKIIE